MHVWWRAQILLEANQGTGGRGQTDEQVAEAVGCRVNAVATVRKWFVELWLEATLGRGKASRPPGRPWHPSNRSGSQVRVRLGTVPRGGAQLGPC